MQQLKEDYRIWLRTLGFAESTVKSLPQYIQEMLPYFETNAITTAPEITSEAIETYFLHWKQRKNKTTRAGLSISHINKCILAINNFVKFLNTTGRHSLILKLEREQVKSRIPEVLTREEIEKLYEATYHLNKRINNEAFGQRDRAMLAVYYGCGLRRNEGNSLEIQDILPERKLIHVRKGKGNKERYVPITEKGIEDLQEYLNYGRQWFLEKRQKKIERSEIPIAKRIGTKSRSNSLFINIWGEPMQDFTSRLRTLQDLAGINKDFSLHTLRHSIATHLLQGGMDIEQIRKFLGHASLESTQIYTHIMNEV
jgi:integrase/recombinase XerD